MFIKLIKFQLASAPKNAGLIHGGHSFKLGEVQEVEEQVAYDLFSKYPTCFIQVDAEGKEAKKDVEVKEVKAEAPAANKVMKAAPANKGQVLV